MHVNNSNSQTWSWFQPPPRNQQQPLPLPQFVDPFVIQQLLRSQADTMPYCEGGDPLQHFYSLPFSVGSVYQGMAQQHQHQHQHQYRAPSSGPGRNRRSKGRRKTEAHYAYHILHELPGAIARDQPTCIHPVYIWMGAFNNPGAGRARRPPSRNPSMVDRNPTRVTPYNRDRSGPSRTRRQRRDSVDLSIYEIPIMDSERNIPAAITAPTPPMLSTSALAPVPSTSATPSPSTLAWATPTLTASSEMSNEETTNTDVQEHPDGEDDFDTISLGSDIDYQY